MNNFSSKVYSAENANYFMVALWWCAGADYILLKKGTYSDQVKMACMGGTILSTAILAFLAGTYAVHTIFSEDISAEITLFEYFFGIVWGIIIFNIDRFIVVSTPPNIEKTIWQKLPTAIPRIIMGIVISLIISKPLEIKIFEKDIELEIARTKEIKFKEIKDAAIVSSQKKSKGIDDKIQAFNNEITSLETEKNNYNENYIAEARIVTVGPRAKAMKEGRDDAEKKIIEIKNSDDYKAAFKEKDQLSLEIENKATAENERVDLGMRSLVNKIKLSHEINPLISWMITFLFIILELTPIIFKLLMEESPFDHQKKNRDDMIKEASLINKSKYDEEQLNLKKEFEEEIKRKKIEFEYEQTGLQEANLKIIEAKNKKYINENLDKILDLEKDKVIIDKLKQSQELEKDKDSLELSSYKRGAVLKTEKDLTDSIVSKYKINKETEISNNPNKFYDALNFIPKNDDPKNHKNGAKAANDNTEIFIDALVKGQTWQPGENYHFIHVLTLKDIEKLLDSDNQDLVQKIYNHKLNRAKTGGNIALSRKDENLITWMNKAGNIARYNLDTVKIEKLYKETKARILAEIEVQNV